VSARTLRDAAALAALASAELRRISQVRTQMLEAHPFWGYLLMQLQPVAAPTLPTFAATDCRRHIWFNPLHTRHLTPAQLGFVLAHEVCHLVFASEDRARGRNHYLWNCATDYAINRIVGQVMRPALTCAMPLYDPPNGRFPGIGKVEILDDDRFEGMIAEAIYEVLAGEVAGCPVCVQLDLDAPGGGRISLPGVLDHRGGIDLHLPEHFSDRVREEIREKLAAAVETWQSSGRRGHVPGDAVRVVTMGRARVPWQRIFRQYVQPAMGRDEFSLTHPARRYLLEDVVVPGVYSERVGRVVVALDTSGSMSQEVLAAAAAEISQLARQAEEATLIVADSTVHAVIPLDRLQEYLAKGHFEGSGGTNHKPVFDHIREAHLAPDLFVGLTDLASEFPDHAPPYPVIWVVPPDHADAPWGRVVEVR
jgi:predicted metal-dependent peptidase